MAVLIDTNVFVAYSLPRDKYHAAAGSALHDLKDLRVVVAPALTELFYLTAERGSHVRAVEAFDLVRSPGFRIEALTDLDMRRMRNILTQYQDAEFDFVDTAIMAVAERLNIHKVCTFDRRDFAVFRPTHVESLTLLPPS